LRLDKSNVNGILDVSISISSVECKNHKKDDDGTFLVRQPVINTDAVCYKTSIQESDNRQSNKWLGKMFTKWQLAGWSGNQPDSCLVGISNQYETNSFWWLTTFELVGQMNIESFCGIFASRSKAKNKSEQLETKEDKVSSGNLWHGYQRE
jgi:hypothetical protein